MILGIDIGATWTRVVLSKENGEFVKRERFRTTTDPVGTALDVAKGWDYDSVGVGSIGPLDLRQGTVVGSANAPSKVFSIADPLLKTGKPFYIANDCVSGVWGEHVYRWRDVRNMVYITISTGIGAGAIVDDNLLLGKDGNAHEVGYVVLDLSSGISCCGGIGYWEGIASGGHMVDAFNVMIQKWGVEPKEKPAQAADIFRLASEGDKAAEKFIDYWLDVNAAGLVTVAVSYDPELVVIGGSVALYNWGLFYDGVRDRMKKTIRIAEPRIEKAAFGDDEVAVGAVALVYEPPSSLKAFGYPRGGKTKA
ncbi:MAG: ROK family protein [Thermoprotei archaeon]|jgi:glucokinase